MDIREIIFILLVLPMMFGLVFLGLGVSKIVHREKSGFVSFVTGLIFLTFTGFAFLFFSSYF